MQLAPLLRNPMRLAIFRIPTPELHGTGSVPINATAHAEGTKGAREARHAVREAVRGKAFPSSRHTLTHLLAATCVSLTYPWPLGNDPMQNGTNGLPYKGYRSATHSAQTVRVACFGGQCNGMALQPQNNNDSCSLVNSATVHRGATQDGKAISTLHNVGTGADASCQPCHGGYWYR